MRFASLGSGSQGNSLIVEAGATRVMIDCGFSLWQSEARLARLGLLASQIDGILVAHEHADHVAGVFKLARKYQIPVWLTHGTHAALRELPDPTVQCHFLDSHSSFSLGALDVAPFPVPHDAREPVQFILGDGVRRLGVLTDVGCLTPHIVNVLSGCEALFLECNHDEAMLAANSAYPPVLKRRISGRLGHLANSSAASLLKQIDTGRLQHVVAAHLSQENNTPMLAASALAAVLGCAAEWVAVADQAQGVGWRMLA